MDISFLAEKMLTKFFKADIIANCSRHGAEQCFAANPSKFASLAQLDRASVYGTEGWGFELLKMHHEKSAFWGALFVV